jgi:exodeoxyribonuclease V alpha subunit
MSETLEGHVERIVYASEHNHYAVAKLKITGNPELVTIVGELVGIAPGQELKLSGAWETHPKYGHQFRATGYSVRLPAQIQGIQKYLGSGLIRGIGPAMAQRLVDRFLPKSSFRLRGLGKNALRSFGKPGKPRGTSGTS